MAVTTSPFFGIQYGWELGDDGWGDPVNTNFKILSFLAGKSVQNVVSSLPASPAVGETYILTTDNFLYARFLEGWLFLQPLSGLEFYVQATGKTLNYNGTSWVDVTSVTQPLLADQVNPTNGAGLVGYKSRTVAARLSDNTSIADGFGAVGDGITDDLIALQNACLAANTRWLNTEPKDYKISAWPVNHKGTRIQGKGKILLSVPTGLRQINTYAHDYQLNLMREHMYKAYARIENGSTTLRIQLYGDSTVATGTVGNSVYEPDFLIKEWLQAVGINKVIVTNYGVSGTSWTDLNAIPNIDTSAGNATDVLVLKYGINDPQNLLNVYNTMRSKIGAIRAATNGDIHKLSIIVMMPTSTYDLPHFRDARWYEQLRDMYVRVCEEFQCVFYDSYASFQDTSTAANFWQDDPFLDGASGVHMKPIGNNWVWKDMAAFVFSQAATEKYSTNRFYNVESGAGFLSATAVLSAFNYGLSMYRVRGTTDGFPTEGDGMAITFRHPDGIGWQKVIPFAQSGRIIERIWDVSLNSWGVWSGTANTPTLLNGWVAFGSTRKAPTYYREGNRGYLAGTIKSGTTTIGTSLMTIPVGMRPSVNGDQICRCRGSAAAVDIGINSNGNVFLQSAGDATETCLDGMSWLIG